MSKSESPPVVVTSSEPAGIRGPAINDVIIPAADQSVRVIKWGNGAPAGSASAARGCGPP